MYNSNLVEMPWLMKGSLIFLAHNIKLADNIMGEIISTLSLVFIEENEEP